jgi:hypothetical protein
VSTEPPVLRRLTTPRAAAWAGVVFAVLFGLSLVLLRTTVPADPLAKPGWVREGSGRLGLALTLLPIAGLAFLWFVGVVRDRLGEYEDRFLSSVLFGSGLLFLAMVFVSAAIAGGLLAGARSQGAGVEYEAVVRFGRSVMLQISNVFALRMAGAFMVSLGTIWLRTGLMPRWLVVVTYLVALALLVVTTLSLWATLLFPGWVLGVSVLLLVTSAGSTGPRDAGPVGRPRTRA